MYSPDVVAALTVAVATELGVTIKLMVRPGGWEEAEAEGLVSGRSATPKGRVYLRTTGKTDELEAMAFPRPPTSPIRTRADYSAGRVAASWLRRRES